MTGLSDPSPSDLSEGTGEPGPIKGPVKVEQTFRIDGRKLTVLVTLPSQVADEIGMEAAVLAANRAIVTIESKNHEVKKVRRSDVAP